MTTEKEFIRQAKVDWPELENLGRPATMVDCLDEYYLNGTYDDVSGDVESPTGHFFRIERWIVVTDSQGFRHLEPYPNEEQAKKAFEKLDNEYAEWSDENE
jgi:hypothetical protein